MDLAADSETEDDPELSGTAREGGDASTTVQEPQAPPQMMEADMAQLHLVAAKPVKQPPTPQLVALKQQEKAE